MSHGPGGFTRDAASAEIDAELVALIDGGATYQQAADHFGWTHKGTAWRRYQRVLQLIPSKSVEEHRANATARLEAQYAALLEIATAPHPLVSNGKRFNDLTDAMPVVAALREMRLVVAQLQRLHGTDAPTRTRIEVLTEDVADAALRALVAEHDELASRSAAREAAPAEGPAGAGRGAPDGAG